jgi:hypothetical protein
VASARRLAKRLDRGAERIQPALIVLGELRRAVDDGKPVHVLLMHLDELTNLLLGVEDAVGVVTPARLFE